MQFIIPGHSVLFRYHSRDHFAKIFWGTEEPEIIDQPYFSDISSITTNEKSSFFGLLKRRNTALFVPFKKTTISAESTGIPNLNFVFFDGDVTLTKSVSDPNMLPLAVGGTFKMSGCRELFLKLGNKHHLPFAETINLTNAIESLDELIGKLPVGLKKLIVQQSLTKSIGNDAKKLESARKFVEYYPDVNINDGDLDPLIYKPTVSENIITVDTQKSEYIHQREEIVIAQTQLPENRKTIGQYAKKLALDPEIPVNDVNKLRDYIRAVAIPELILDTSVQHVIRTDEVRMLLAEDYNDIKNIILREIKFVEPIATNLKTATNVVRPIVKMFYTMGKPLDEIQILVKQALDAQPTNSPTPTAPQQLPKEDKPANSKPEKRMLWLNQSVIDRINSWAIDDKNIALERLDWFLNNPGAVPKDTNRFEIVEEIAEIKKHRRGGLRLYASRQVDPALMIFDAGNKGEQKDLDPRKMAKDFKQKYGSARTVSDQLANAAPGAETVQIQCTSYISGKTIKFFETFYNFDTDTVRQKLGIKTDTKPQPEQKKPDNNMLAKVWSGRGSNGN
ncbi:MAG: hypothetical protein IJ866_01035 [Alphaproteobacteria bacterium]|nr:hypothetical protein [Alphaproteobacteria bacterium]